MFVMDFKNRSEIDNGLEIILTSQNRGLIDNLNSSAYSVTGYKV